MGTVQRSSGAVACGMRELFWFYAPNPEDLYEANRPGYELTGLGTS